MPYTHMNHVNVAQCKARAQSIWNHDEWGECTHDHHNLISEINTTIQTRNQWCNINRLQQDTSISTHVKQQQRIRQHTPQM